VLVVAMQLAGRSEVQVPSLSRSMVVSDCILLSSWGVALMIRCPPSMKTLSVLPVVCSNSPLLLVLQLAW
jgi:hypothetical protein